MSCNENYKKARDLAYKNPTNPSALDSALIIVDKCMKCDSIKTAVVDLKIRLLITLRKFNEGAEFVDSLQTSDFTYTYKKKLTQDNFLALNFASNKDTNSRDVRYRIMATDLESHINSNNLKSNEFQEAVIDLHTLTDNLNDSALFKRQIDSLKIKYPQEVKFLDFIKL